MTMRLPRFALTLDGSVASVREVLSALVRGCPCMVGAFLLVGPTGPSAEEPDLEDRRGAHRVDARDAN